MSKVITGFESEQDIRLTLEAMERKGWESSKGDAPTKFLDIIRDTMGPASDVCIRFQDRFLWAGKSYYSSEPSTEFINFKDAIKELDGVKPIPGIITHKNMMDFLGKKFTARMNGNSIEGIISKQKESPTIPTLYFNIIGGNGSAGWTTDGSPGYRRGWSVCDNSDFNALSDFRIVEDKSSSLPELPEFFTIHSKNKDHPLWKKYISWLSKKTGLSIGGVGNGFYGVHKNNGPYNYHRQMQGEKEITLEEWDSITHKYEDMIDTYRKVTTEDVFDPCSHTRYPIKMEPKLTPYVMENPELLAEATEYIGGESARYRTATGASKIIEPSTGGLADQLTVCIEALEDPFVATGIDQAGISPTASTAFKAAQASNGIAPRVGISYPTAPVTKKSSRYSDMLSNI